ncbi:unnamed protein product, partial [Urochloa humidicola]
MNVHLNMLRSLTPALYIKRGDQASIIGGAIDSIRELHQVLESLKACKKRRGVSWSWSPKASHGGVASPGQRRSDGLERWQRRFSWSPSGVDLIGGGFWKKLI